MLLVLTLLILGYLGASLITSLKLYQEGFPEGQAVVGGWLWFYVFYYRVIRRSWFGVNFQALRRHLQMKDRTQHLQRPSPDPDVEAPPFDRRP